jgi:hypothetical protein
MKQEIHDALGIRHTRREPVQGCWCTLAHDITTSKFRIFTAQHITTERNDNDSSISSQITMNQSQQHEQIDRMNEMK